MLPEINAPDVIAPAAVDALTTLHTRLVDAVTSFARMVETAEPGFRPVAEQFRSLHARHADVLSRMLSSIGHTAAAGGSYMGMVNEAVISIRALFHQIDADVMDGVRRSEQQVLDAFETAMGLEVPPTHLSDLRTMRDELTALLDQTDHLD